MAKASGRPRYRAFFERVFVIAISVRFAAPVQAQGPLLSEKNE
jgi:hypothetical protein